MRRPGGDRNPVTRLTVALPMSRITWDSALRDFTTALRAAGRSPRTIRLYLYRIQHVTVLAPYPDQVTIEQLLTVVAREGWEPETRKSVRTSLRAFFRWAHATGRLPDDPSVALPPVRIPPAAPRPAPEHVVAAGRLRGGRTAFMVELGAYAGLRAGEICRVHSDDLAGDELRVRGKGGRERVVPIQHAGLLARLQAVEGWAFPNGRGGHLSAGHVSRLVSQALPGVWTAHPLRHRFGTTAYEGTGDLFAVQELLGHSDPATTRRYVLLGRQRVRAAAAAASVA